MATQSSKPAAKTKTQAKRATTEAEKIGFRQRQRRQARGREDRRRREEPGPGRRRDRRRLPGRRRALSVSDRVGELVEPWTSRDNAEQTDQGLPHPAAQNPETDRAPRHQRPQKATTEARKTRNRVEREARAPEAPSRRR